MHTVPLTPAPCGKGKSTLSYSVLLNAQGLFIKGSVLSNADSLRKLYMVNINPEAWDDSDLLYRTPEHWQAVTVSPLL